MRKWKLVLKCLLAAVCATSGGTAVAQSYPAKVIRIVVPFPPGGPTDLYARVIGQKLQEAWGQPVIVDNRPGGTGLLGSDIVRQAPADGYTLLFTSNSAHVMGPLLREPRSFDPVRDFTPVSMVIRYPMYILVNAGVPARSLGELIALAKARPAQLNYSSVGTGSGGHLACELLNVAAGTQIVHVPYKGAAPAQTALVAGEAQVMCDSVGNSHALVVAGKLRGTRGHRRAAFTGGARRADAHGARAAGRGLYLAGRAWTAGDASRDHGEAQRRNRAHHESAGRARARVERRLGSRCERAGKIRQRHAGRVGHLGARDPGEGHQGRLTRRRY